ncbi:TetR/AcrR family transcriptional regulator [Leifsonia sp. PS1209]|uniref:TetR/AcrR family transcriptional regulator n=1 Tax=Leifsonia sp. PS1209 TaxID=2724914 RepID=UPI001442BEEC|nr:TetR/AcrR family transcriptional regulator [Leifsonia sp. PS1209]QIZ99904.1 TetR/AcrR family transcriptional regulator [Leifsonia sp. PS1209]
MSADATQPSGRPRDSGLEHRIIEATQDLLIEREYVGTTIAAVAARARCGKSAIYRRWETKVDLVVAAVRATQTRLDPQDTGSLREDLRRTAMHFAGSDERSGRILASLLSALGSDPDLYQAANRDVGSPPAAALREVIERWIARGVVPADVPVALIAGLVPTAAFGSVVLRKQYLDEEAVTELIDRVVLPALGQPTGSAERSTP